MPLSPPNPNSRDGSQSQTTQPLLPQINRRLDPPLKQTRNLRDDPRLIHTDASDGARDINRSVRAAFLQLAAVRAIPVRAVSKAGIALRAHISYPEPVQIGTVRELRGLLRAVPGRGEEHEFQ